MIKFTTKQFTTKKVNLNLDLMQNAFLDNKVLNLQENALFQHKVT